jgi:hypothetical protein
MAIPIRQSTAKSSGRRARRIARSGWLPIVTSQARRKARVSERGRAYGSTLHRSFLLSHCLALSGPETLTMKGQVPGMPVRKCNGVLFDRHIVTFRACFRPAFFVTCFVTQLKPERTELHTAPSGFIPVTFEFKLLRGEELCVTQCNSLARQGICLGPRGRRFESSRPDH